LFLLLLLFSIVMSIAMNTITLLSDPRWLPWKPSILWGAFALLLVLSLLVLPDGAIHLLGGKRLGLASGNWRRLSWFAAVLFVVLALLNIILLFTVSDDAWAAFRLSAPFGGILLFSLFGPGIVAPNSNAEDSLGAHRGAA